MEIKVQTLSSSQRCWKWWPHGSDPWRNEAAELALHALGKLSPEISREASRGTQTNPALLAGRRPPGDANPQNIWRSGLHGSAYALALTLSVQPFVSFTFFSLSSSVAFTPNTKVGLSLTQLLVYPPCQSIHSSLPYDNSNQSSSLVLFSIL